MPQRKVAVPGILVGVAQHALKGPSFPVHIAAVPSYVQLCQVMLKSNHPLYSKAVGVKTTSKVRCYKSPMAAARMRYPVGDAHALIYYRLIMDMGYCNMCL